MGAFDDLPSGGSSFDDLPVGRISGGDADKLMADWTPEDRLRYADFRAKDTPFNYMPKVTGTMISDAADVIKAGLSTLGRELDENPRTDTEPRSPAAYFQRQLEKPSRQPTRGESRFAGATEGAKSLAQGVIEHPELLPIAEIPLAGRALAGYFGYKGATEALPEGYRALKEAEYAGDTGGKDEAYGRLSIDGIFTALAAAQIGRPGLAKEVPGLHDALLRKVTKEYSSPELKDIYRRVNTADEAQFTPQERELVLRLNNEFPELKQVLRQGVTETTAAPVFKNQGFNEWLGVETPAGTSYALRGAQEPPAAEPAPAPSPAPGSPSPEAPRTRSAFRRGRLVRDAQPEAVTETVPETAVTVPEAIPVEPAAVPAISAPAAVSPAGEIQPPAPVTELPPESPTPRRTSIPAAPKLRRVTKEQQKAADKERAAQELAARKAAAAGAKEFRDLVIEYGSRLGYLPEDFIHQPRTKGGHDAVSVTGQVKQDKQVASAMRGVMIKLGADAGDARPEARAALVPKLKEMIAEYEAQEAAKQPDTEDFPEGTDTSFLPPEDEAVLNQERKPTMLGTDFDPRSIKQIKSVNFALNQGKMPLSQFIDAPELFSKYPALRQTTLEVRPVEDKIGGWWNFDDKTIVVAPQHEIPFFRILIHEIAHAVETIEGRPPSEANAEAVVERLRKGHPQNLPTLRSGERGTGDLLQGADQPFNLAGETQVDFERVAREKQEAATRAVEAQRLQEQQQGKLFTEPNGPEAIAKQIDSLLAERRKVADKLNRNQGNRPELENQLESYRKQIVQLQNQLGETTVLSTPQDLYEAYGAYGESGPTQKAAASSAPILYSYPALDKASLSQIVRGAKSVARVTLGRIDAAAVRAVEPNLSDPSTAARMGMDAATRQALEEFFGARIQFVEVPGELLVNGFKVPGMDDVVFVNINSQEPALAVTGHEFLHHIQFTDPELYAQLTDELIPLVKNLAAFKQRLEQATGSTVPDDVALNELVANFLGDNVMEPRFWEDVGNANPNLFLRFANALMAFLTRLMLKLRNFGSSKYFTNVAQARQILARNIAKFKARTKSAMGEPLFSRIDPETVRDAADLVRNPSPSEKPLVAALVTRPTQALMGHTETAFKGLSPTAQNRLPEVQERFKMLDSYGRVPDPRPLSEQAKELFPDNPDFQYQMLAAAFSNAERLRANREQVSLELNKVIDTLTELYSKRDRIHEGDVEAKATRNLARQMIEQMNDGLDQRIQAERNAVERALLEQSRKLVAEFLPTERMATVIRAGAKLSLTAIRQLAKDIQKPDSTVASLKQKYRIFDHVSDEVAQQALGVMKLNQSLYDQLVTAKNAGVKDLARDIASLDQARIGNKLDVRKFANRFAELKAKSDQHSKLLDAVTRDISKVFKEYMALNSAMNYLETTIASEPFQRNWNDAIQKLGATTVIKKDTGLEVTYPNPNNPEESVTIPEAMDHKTAVQNSAKLAQLAGWMMEYIENGPDPVLKNSYRIELNRINDLLRNPQLDPKTGNRLTRGAFDLTRLFSGFGRYSTPDTVGRYLGGEMGQRVRQAVRNFSDARGRVMNQFAELSDDTARKSFRAAQDHKMTVDEWIRRVSDPILESYMSVGDRQLEAGDSLPGGLMVSNYDMSAIAAQARFIKKLMGDIQTLPQELRGFLFAPAKITVTPDRPGGRVIQRDPIPLTKYGVPRRISAVGMELARSWQQAVKDLKDEPRRLLEEQVKLINDPKYKDIFLSYFRTFSDPSFIVKSPLKEAALEVNRDINLGSEPANFNDWISRLQEKEAQRGSLLSKPQVQGLILRDLNQVMAAVAGDMQERDLSATAPETDIIDTQNFMNRPRGDTIALKGMYDLSIVNLGQQTQKAAAITEVYGQAMLNSWRAALEALKQKKTEFEARIKAGESRTKVNQTTADAMRRGDEFYKLDELDALMSDLQRNIGHASSKERNQAAFEQQMVAPRGMRLVKGFVLPGLLQRVSVMANNLFGGVNKMNQMDILFGLTQPPLGLDTPLIKWPTSLVANSSRAAKNLVGATLHGISAAYMGTAHGQKLRESIEQNPDLYQGFAGAMLRRMVQWTRRYEEAERLGLYNYAPFWSTLSRRLELRSIGGEIRGNNPTEAVRQFDKLANIIEGVLETGVFLGRAPAAWLPGVVDAAINATSWDKTQEMLGVLQLNILKAFQRRIALGEDPAQIRLTPPEYFGRPSDKNMEKEYAHLQTLFNENGMNLDELARQYYANVKAAGPDAGQVSMVDKLGLNSLTSTVSNEMNRAGFANRPQNAAHDTWGRFFMNLLGYGINENSKLGILWSNAARNPKKFAELQTALKIILPMMLLILTLGSFVAAPVIDKLLEVWEGKKRARPQITDAESGTDVLKAVGYASGPLLPTVGQFLNNMVQPDAPGRGLLGSNLQLLPLSLAQSTMQLFRQMGQTGEILRPLLQFNAQFNPAGNVVWNRIPYMAGWQAFQNDIAVQRAHTPSSIETRKQGSGAPAQYSPVWGQIQDIKNELGKKEPDYAKIEALRTEGIRKLEAGGNADAAKSFDRTLLASANKYLNIYGRELTESEKARIDTKKTPAEREESERIDGNVAGYANHFGDPVPDFVRVPKDERASQRQLTREPGSSGSAALGLSSAAVSVGRMGGGNGGEIRQSSGNSRFRTVGIPTRGLRASRGRRGYGLRRISSAPRGLRRRGLRSGLRRPRLRRV